MAYISETFARMHLRHTTDADIEDVRLKIEMATDIIRDYLKDRADKRITIVSSSVANPTVLETEEAHGFVTGDTVTISDHADATPELTGPYAVTVTSTDTFTVPVNVTVAGTGGTAVVLWDEDTVPLRVKQATLLMFVHLYEHRGDDMRLDEDLWSAIGRLLARSRDPAFA